MSRFKKTINAIVRRLITIEKKNDFIAHQLQFGLTTNTLYYVTFSMYGFQEMILASFYYYFSFF
jgi:hypothetical protein